VRGSSVTREDRQTVQDKVAFTFQRNIVSGWEAAHPDEPWPDLGLTPPRDLYQLDHNLYWNGGKPVAIPARDKDSLAADPLLVDPAHGDFALRFGSPALQVGFVPFDIRGAGRFPQVPADFDPARWPRVFPAAR
jgi:hypothetical protein